MNHMNIDKIIRETIEEISNELDVSIVDMKQDTILLQSGLDSLGFAVLVSKLEDKLGYDPFVIMSTPVYPKTYDDFLRIYLENVPTKLQ